MRIILFYSKTKNYVISNDGHISNGLVHQYVHLGENKLRANFGDLVSKSCLHMCDH